ncbi:MAG: KEOPS complex subunit Cgi121 [Methanoregula sp.]|nr:KEOPS complex subunit Cgi121 [Methanoregula sp.]MDD5023711.1 KEOPS complex subunit Cgi121 [Methanoregula sp.]MDD5187987.1 KEOPS complex subunit Cgi121 [Methanoregula sp.]
MESPHHSCECRCAVSTTNDRVALLAEIREIADRHQTRIVCFDAEKLACRAHAEHACRFAWRSFYSGTPISNSFEMEALLYAAGTRQCSVAATFGIHNGENRLYVCCCPARDGIWDDLARHLTFVPGIDESMTEEKTTRLMALFGITEEECAAAGPGRIPALVLERVAFLEVSK